MLVVTPSVEFASDRTTVTPASANGLAPVYHYTGSFVTAALRLDYDLTERVSLGVGARALFDRYYMLTDGFPKPSRSFFVGLRARSWRRVLRSGQRLVLARCLPTCQSSRRWL